MTSDRNEPREDAPREPLQGQPQDGLPGENTGLPGEEPTQRIPQEQDEQSQAETPDADVPHTEAPEVDAEEAEERFEAGPTISSAHAHPAEPHPGEPSAGPAGPGAPHSSAEETSALPVFSPYGEQPGAEQPATDQSGAYPASQAQPAGHYFYPPGPPAPPTYPGQPAQDVHPSYVTPQQEAPKRSIGVGGFTAGMLVAALVGGGVAVGWGALSGDGSAAPGGGIEINNPESATEVTAAAAKASPSVVTLAVTGQQGAGSGSGIVLDDQGHVLTNTHVVTLGGQTNSPEISVQTHDGSVTSAEVVGTDPLSDLAVVQLDDTSGVTPAEMGSSGDLNVGDQAIAIGAPLGLEGTVTDGIISTLNRTISVASADAGDEEAEEAPEEPEEGQEDPEGFEFFFPDQDQAPTQGYIHLNVIQTDAAINQGNSGGALVDGQGNIVGVNVAIASAGGGGGGQMGQTDAGSIGVGFAIPIDYAQRVAEELIDNGEVSHGLLGVQVLDSSAEGLEPEDAMFHQGFTNGAVIDNIPDGSPAGESGLQSGDRITHVDDRPVTNASSLTAIVREYAAGDTVTVTYIRDDQAHEVEVTLDGM